MVVLKRRAANEKEKWPRTIVIGVLLLTVTLLLLMRQILPQESDNNGFNDASLDGYKVNKHKANNGDGTMIRKREGIDWKLWDGISVLHADNPSHWECNWGVYRPAHAINAIIGEAPMCLPPRKHDVFVTGFILDLGHWPDCNDLTPNLLKQPKPAGGRRTIHLDIGANIGSCVLQVLLTTPNDVDVYAFEPHPHNLFHLTSTLLALDRTLRERVFLFPVALGETTGASTIQIDPTNAGNAMVQHGGDDGGGSDSVAIRIERLDDLLDFSSATTPDDPHRISQIKMDAQGFECFILEGMSETLRRSSSLVFEVEPASLARIGDDGGGECSAAALVQRVREAGLTQLRRYKGTMGQGKGPNDVPDDFTSLRDAIDLVATRPATSLRS